MFSWLVVLFVWTLFNLFIYFTCDWHFIVDWVCIVNRNTCTYIHTYIHTYNLGSTWRLFSFFFSLFSTHREVKVFGWMRKKKAHNSLSRSPRNNNSEEKRYTKERKQQQPWYVNRQFLSFLVYIHIYRVFLWISPGFVSLCCIKSHVGKRC